MDIQGSEDIAVGGIFLRPGSTREFFLGVQINFFFSSYFSSVHLWFSLSIGRKNDICNLEHDSPQHGLQSAFSPMSTMPKLHFAILKFLAVSALRP